MSRQKVNPRFYTFGLHDIPDAARLCEVPEELLQHAIAQGHLETAVIGGTVMTSVRAVWRCMRGASALSQCIDDDEDWEDLDAYNDDAEPAALEDLDMFAGAADDEEKDASFSGNGDDDYAGDPELQGGRFSGYGIETGFALTQGHHRYVPDSAPGTYPYVVWFKDRYPGLYEMLDALAMDDLTPADAADLFGVSQSTLSRYCDQAKEIYLREVAEEQQRKVAEIHATLYPSPVAPAPVAYPALIAVPKQDGRLARGERERQRIWDTMYAYERGHGQPPTKRELMAALRLSSDTQLRRHLTTMVKQGRLCKGSGPRGLHVVNAPAVKRPVRGIDY